MLAAWYEKHGAAREVLRVGEQPDPVPGRGEVRVRLHASAVNPSDVKARAGSRPVIPPRVIPDSDGAGEIDRVGSGVPKRRLRQRVWVYNGQWQRASGTSAQYIALSAALAVPLPRKLSYAEGACLGIPVMTAHRCLFADGPIRGANVLVTGGAGVVGHYAVQLARWAGAWAQTPDRNLIAGERREGPGVASSMPLLVAPRHALVVGNSSYGFGPLKNPANDARALGEELKRAGFQVTTGLDLTRQQMLETFRDLPEDEIAAMLGGNAARVYGFDPSKLAPLVARIGPEKRAFQQSAAA